MLFQFLADVQELCGLDYSPDTSAFYEQVTGVKGLIFPFSFISVFALLLFWLRGMLLSTVFLCAL